MAAGGTSLASDAGRRARRAVRWVTWPLRPAPDVFVVGAPASGAEQLHEQLARDAPIVGVDQGGSDRVEELDVGLVHYRSGFPVRRSGASVSVEALPRLLAHPTLPAHLGRLRPDARLIVVLRDPAERAVAHWAELHRAGHDARSFAELVADELAAFERGDGLPDESNPRLTGWLERHVLHHGLARRHVETWLRYFPAERMSVVHHDDLADDIEATVGRTRRFLGLDVAPGTAPTTRGRDAGSRDNHRIDVHPATLAEVRAFYRRADPHQDDLFRPRRDERARVTPATTCAPTAGRSPGAAQARMSMWVRASNPETSVQYGRPQPRGAFRSR